MSSLSDSPNLQEEIIYDVLESGMGFKDLYLYQLQQQAPKPRMVPCTKPLDSKPNIYGDEYHGMLTRGEANEILMTQADGSYLVRASSQRPGEYSLSFKYQKPRHFLLYHNETGYFVGDGSFDTVEELVADGLISLYMEEHNVEQYINRQIFRRKSCKRSSRFEYIASARRALARYKDNKANGTVDSCSIPKPAKSTEDLNSPSLYVTLMPPENTIVRSSSAPSKPKIKPPVPPRSSSLSPLAFLNPDAEPRSPEKYESYEPLYDAVNIEDIAKEPEYEAFYSTIDDQPIYSIPAGEDDFTSDEDSEYLTQEDDDEGTPPPLPPRTEIQIQKSKKVKRRESKYTNCPFTYEKSHSFKVASFKGPTWCDHCKNFLWGLKRQGFKCEDCGMCVHKQCLKEMENDCQPSAKYVNGVYGVELVTVLKLQQMKIPNVVRECISEVEARGMESVGVYRMSGKVEEVTLVKESFNSSQDPKLNSFQDINAITGSLKSFLRSLPTPLIHGDCYTQLMEQVRQINHHAERSDELVEKFKECLKHLPLAHYNVLRYLIKHLQRVADLHETNKMTADNLAVVFAPTLMKSIDEQCAFADLSQQRKLVEFLILNYHEIF